MAENIRQLRKGTFINQYPTHIIIDHDGGTDNVLCLFTLIRFAKVFGKNVLGITCSNGKRDLNNAFADSIATIKVLNASINVYKGAQQSLLLSKDYPKTKMQINDNSELDAINNKVLANTNLEDFSQSQSAYQFIAQASRKYSKDLMIIALGPLTNIALAFHRNYSLIYVGALIVNGGQYTGVGDVIGANAEANFHYDSFAASVIFSNFKKIIVYPLEMAFEIQFQPILTSVIQNCSSMQEYQKDIIRLISVRPNSFIVQRGMLIIATLCDPTLEAKCYDVFSEIVLTPETMKGFLAINWLEMNEKDNKYAQQTHIIASLKSEKLTSTLLKIFI